MLILWMKSPLTWSKFITSPTLNYSSINKMFHHDYFKVIISTLNNYDYDFYSKIDYKKVFILSKKHDLIPVVIEDDYEKLPVNVGLVEMQDNETGEMILTDTNSRAYKKSIINRKNKRDSFFKELKKLDIEPMLINTRQDIEKSIISYFEKRIKKVKK